MYVYRALGKYSEVHILTALISNFESHYLTSSNFPATSIMSFIPHPSTGYSDTRESRTTNNGYLCLLRLSYRLHKLD